MGIDVSADIEEVKAIKIVKKSNIIWWMGIGTIVGGTFMYTAGEAGSWGDQSLPSIEYKLGYVNVAALIGRGIVGIIGLFTGCGKDEIVQIEGKSD